MKINICDKCGKKEDVKLGAKSETKDLVFGSVILQLCSDCQKEVKMFIIDGDQLTCAIDGNQLSIIRHDFVNLQESNSVFIKLTNEQIEFIEELRDENVK